MSSQNMPLVFISGLGINRHVFNRIKLDEHPVCFLDWENPDKGESIEEYSSRLYQQYKLLEDPILIGLSFGGIISLEIARNFPVKKVILISSIKGPKERPVWFQLFQIFPAYKLFSLSFFIKTLPIWGFIFGLHSKRDRNGFKKMFHGSSTRFVHWAIRQIVRLKEKELPACSVYHLHGNKDMIFPFQRIKDPICIDGGDHGMIVTKAGLLNQKLKEIIAEKEE